MFSKQLDLFTFEIKNFKGETAKGWKRKKANRNVNYSNDAMRNVEYCLLFWNNLQISSVSSSSILKLLPPRPVGVGSATAHTTSVWCANRMSGLCGHWRTIRCGFLQERYIFIINFLDLSNISFSLIHCCYVFAFFLSSNVCGYYMRPPCGLRRHICDISWFGWYLVVLCSRDFNYDCLDPIGMEFSL